MIGKPHHLQREGHRSSVCGCYSTLTIEGTAKGVNCLRCRKTKAYLELRAKERRGMIKTLLFPSIDNQC